MIATSATSQSWKKTQALQSLQSLKKSFQKQGKVFFGEKKKKRKGKKGSNSKYKQSLAIFQWWRLVGM